MKRTLTLSDIEAAVLGGAILGGGGGGFVEPGLATARLALQVGTPELWSVDELDEDDLVATVALVGAPAAPDPVVTPRHLVRALDLLRRELPDGRLSALHSNENGAETTVNGWFQSALTGMPVLDFACNGRAHPTSVMGAMGLHHDPGYVSVQGFAGGHPSRYVDGVATGRIDATSAVVRRASIDAGGWVGAARNPVTVGYAARNGAPGAISAAIELGRRHLAGGVDAVVDHLGGAVIASGAVIDYRCRQDNGLDVGLLTLDDDARTTLHFVNEYMVLEHGSSRVSAFPDLIMTFVDGHPVPSAGVKPGDELTVITAPAANLLLAPTMFMPELYAPLEESLGLAFAPREAVLAGA